MSTIRYAEAADEAAWRTLWAGFAAFYAVDLPETVTASTWARCIDPASPMGLRLAEQGGRVVGFALHVAHPSSWSPGDDVYLEDLYVAPEARGRGIGRALIEDLIALARSRGWRRVYWMAAADNAQARRLYDSFTRDDGHLRYRLAV